MERNQGSAQLRNQRPSIAPQIQELSPAPNPADVFVSLSGLPHCLFLDSALQHAELGRFSYVMADPYDFVRVAPDTPHPLDALQNELANCQTVAQDELPSFQGGAAGLFSYDLSRSFEKIGRPRHDEFGLPAVAVGLYDVVFAFDHRQRRAWIISQGWPERDESRRRERSLVRMSQFLQRLDTPALRSASNPRTSKRLDLAGQSPHYSVPGPDGLLSNFTDHQYCEAVRAAIDYIHAGDIYQVNLSQRLVYPQTTDVISLYLRLRKENPAPFAGYFDLGDFQLVSASPERFLQVQDGTVETRPIKGTRQRALGPEADLFSGDDLRGSEKDRAENVMIVDLMRNDLARVCDPDSVCVEQLCEVENYQYVQHLVSAVTGRLAHRQTSLDLLQAAFPGGSISGAPKVRAMEIISEIEPHARGAYCGSLGYLTADGEMDLSILIRTITSGNGWWQLPVGGGIVAQSDPRQEYAETWHKAEGLLRAIANHS
jgi:para-aminobenzoate synthetase component 1